jgi:hypothetical protein
MDDLESGKSSLSENSETAPAMKHLTGHAFHRASQEFYQYLSTKAEIEAQLARVQKDKLTCMVTHPDDNHSEIEYVKKLEEFDRERFNKELASQKFQAMFTEEDLRSVATQIHEGSSLEIQLEQLLYLVRHIMMPGLDEKVRDDQSAFRTLLWEYYALGHPDNDRKDPTVFWCPISQARLDTEGIELRAAHLAPVRLGSDIFRFLFGDDQEPLGARNGLYIHYKLEKNFDLFRIAIVPTSSDEDDHELKLIIIDKSLMKAELSRPKSAEYPPTGEKGTITYADLHGQPLQFRNQHRPGLRFLYFHYVMCLLRAKEGFKSPNQPWDFSAWKEHILTKGESRGHDRYWATAGKWVRGTILETLARMYGHDPDLTPGHALDTSSTREQESEEVAEAVKFVDDTEIRFGTRKPSNPSPPSSTSQ